MSSHLFIRSFSATSLVKYSGDPVQLSGMSLSGSGAVVNLKNAKIQSDDFNILDQKKSALRNLEYRINGSGDSSFVLIPEINFIPDVNQVFRSGVISADSVIIHMPVISL